MVEKDEFPIKYDGGKYAGIKYTIHSMYSAKGGYMFYCSRCDIEPPFWPTELEAHGAAVAHITHRHLRHYKRKGIRP